MQTENTDSIKSFTELNAWKKGHKFVLYTYKATENFPREEVFSLVSQLRRAAVSITSNIAEGFSRHTKREKIKFYTIALGSIAEVQNQLLICRDLGYIDEDTFQKLSRTSVLVQKLLNGLVNSARDKI